VPAEAHGEAGRKRLSPSKLDRLTPTVLGFDMARTHSPLLTPNWLRRERRPPSRSARSTAPPPTELFSSKPISVLRDSRAGPRLEPAAHKVHRTKRDRPRNAASTSLRTISQIFRALSHQKGSTNQEIRRGQPVSFSPSHGRVPPTSARLFTKLASSPRNPSSQRNRVKNGSASPQEEVERPLASHTQLKDYFLGARPVITARPSFF